MLFYSVLKFPLGQILLARGAKGLSHAQFIKNKTHLEGFIANLEKKYPPLSYNENKFYQENKLFERYFRGKPEDFTSLSIDLTSATPSQRKVWLETRKIPFGEALTYKYIAQKLNHRGYRSIGQALARNPLLIVIPCHRVIRTDGTLGGFSAGLKLKRFLLQLERG